jgi:hypothetical protein
VAGGSSVQTEGPGGIPLQFRNAAGVCSARVKDRCMDLADITAMEEEWLTRRSSIQGTIERRVTLYARLAIFDAWQEIFQKYVTLAKLGDLEALKRAVFLLWYQYSVPLWVSGLLGLDGQGSREVLQILDRMAKEDKLDLELQWMLPHYYRLADYYLEVWEGLDLAELKKASQKNWDLRDRCIRQSSFAHRGLFGEYWASLQAGERAAPKTEVPPV